MDEDSKENTQQDDKPAGPTSIVVANQHGHLREVQKDEKGRFIKKAKPLIPTIEFVRKERKILFSPINGKDGMTEHEEAFINILRIAQNKDKDPKAMMAAVKAYEIIMRRALGKEAPSEQEMDKLTTQAVRVIMVPVPQIMHPEVVDADKVVDKKTQPTFAEVTSITTNEKPEATQCPEKRSPKR
jgi:hypothetical protein